MQQRNTVPLRDEVSKSIHAKLFLFVVVYDKESELV